MQRDHRVDAQLRWQRSRVGDARVLLEPQPRHLAPLDLRGRVAQRRRIQAQLERTRGVANERPLAVEDARRVAARHDGPEVVQLTQGRGVEGACLHAIRPQGAQAAHGRHGVERLADRGLRFGLLAQPIGHPADAIIQLHIFSGPQLLSDGVDECAGQLTHLLHIRATAQDFQRWRGVSAGKGIAESADYPRPEQTVQGQRGRRIRIKIQA